MKIFRFLGILFFIFAGPMAAFTLAEVEPSASSSQVWLWFKKGGILMYPLVFCSLLSLAVILERIFALQKSKIIPPDVLKKLQHCWEQGEIHAILPLCQKTDAPLTRILATGFGRIDLGLLETERAIEGAGQHEVSLLNTNLRLLGAVGVLSPMLGLLGTVTGMIQAFENITQSSADKALVASGIAEALTTTAAGLFVAIPTLAAYHFFRGKIDRLVYEMEEIANALLSGLQGRKPSSANEEISHADSQSR
ncbi:MAG: MotA/TolQ/ExbB proton channel family protein [Deltaproteobacteria bacterium]|nr:MotA/TolQ/ExbB proton channel family protein [Deltaproteobacteria bacterium]